MKHILEARTTQAPDPDTCRMDPRISIIIPCRNDAVALNATLDGVSRLAGALAVEVIVAAAGDDADTRDAACGRARVVWPGGTTRAELLNAGAAVARAPVLLFLHADSHLPDGAVALVEEALRDPRVFSGAFEHRFSERDWRLWIVSAINRLRYRATRNYYGDQGQFVRTDVFRAVGGFPSVKMMEDLELSQRLKRLGRTALIRAPLRTAGRRFLQRGPWRTLVHCGLLLTVRACGGNVDRYAEFWRGPDDQAPGTPVPRSTRPAEERTAANVTTGFALEVEMHRNGNTTADILKGAVAGAAAMWLMTQATTWMYEQEDAEARKREDEARGDRTAYEIAAERAAGIAGVELSKEQRGQAGLAIHWACGIGAGIVYALLRRRAPAVTAGSGLAFGTGFYLVLDEFMNPVLGLTPGPRAFPWQAHARGLGGHLVFGLANDLILDGLDRVVGKPSEV